MRRFIAIAAVAASLAGCQTVEQSQANAHDVCSASGLRTNTRAYARCINANVRRDQQQNDAVAGAVVAGAAAGILGAAIIAGSNDRYYYGRPYRRGYYRSGYYAPNCNAWGCY